MAVINPILPTEAGAAPSPTAVGASDTIPVGASGAYLLIVENTGGGADTVNIDDPTYVAPTGAQTPGNPDISGVVAATTGKRHWLLRASRLRDVNGNINVTHSATAGVTAQVYGPLQGLPG